MKYLCLLVLLICTNTLFAQEKQLYFLLDGTTDSYNIFFNSLETNKYKRAVRLNTKKDFTIILISNSEKYTFVIDPSKIGRYNIISIEGNTGLKESELYIIQHATSITKSGISVLPIRLKIKIVGLVNVEDKIMTGNKELDKYFLENSSFFYAH